MASKNSNANPAAPDVRRGWAGVNVEIDARVDSDGSYIYLTYRGTVGELLAAGCLTLSMMAARAARPRGGRPQRDEHGKRFTLHRSPTKYEPDRMKLQRRGDPGIAMQLPGVRELFPEGFPEPAQAEAQSSEPAAADTGAATASDWKEERLDGMDSDLRFLESWNGKQWRGVGEYASPRFRFADGDIQTMESILHRFRTDLFAALDRAAVIDTHATPRPAFLRLVVDNTREVDHA
jgi:hypothetical protein